MAQIGRRIYYDLATGNIIIDTGERQGAVVATTIEQDIKTFTTLSQRNRETFSVLELAFGAYAQDFAESNGYRVNPTTKTLEFSYLDPDQPEAEPVYQASLSEQLVEKEKQIELLRQQIQQTNDDMAAFMDFVLTNGGI